MIALIQRHRGHCSIESRIDSINEKHSFDGPGLVVLLGWEKRDLEVDLESVEKKIFDKVCGMRIFPDEEGKMNYSLKQFLDENNERGGILWVPQFTLAAKCEKGFRPSFVNAMPPDLAKNRFAQFAKKIDQAPMNCDSKDGLAHIKGVFGANMMLDFCNWGPVTIPLFF